MRRRLWAWGRPVGGAAILALVLWRVGTGPIIDGIRTIDARAVAAATAIAAVTTVCCAWRWSVVARGLGVAVPLPAAIAAYYRSQFLNTTLPGGVLGDVHRGLRHGRDVGDLGRGLRAVAWERGAGQAVQLVVALAVLAGFPSPMRASLRLVLPLLVAAGLVIAAVARRRFVRRSRWGRIVAAEAREGVLARHAWPRITLASVVVVAGHAATFLIAARTAGSTASVATLLPLAMVVLLAMTVPANVAGWGPREGVAAWAFAAAGLGSAQGVAAATVYGILVFVASLPGLGVLLLARRRRARGLESRAPRAEAVAETDRAVLVGDADGARHG